MEGDLEKRENIDQSDVLLTFKLSNSALMVRL